MRQALRVALGLALGFLVAAAWPASRRLEPAPRLLPADLGPGAFQDEAAGHLAEIVVHYEPGMGGKLAAVYSELFAALDPDTTARVVCPERADFDDLTLRLKELGRPVRPKLAAEPVGHAVTGWAKDRFVAWRPERAAGPAVILLAPPRPLATSAGRLGDWSVPGELAARSGGRLRSAVLPLEFDGGDFAATGDAVLCGWTLMTRNPQLAALGPERARQRLAALAGRRAVLLGRKPGDVPEHHVNMYALPLAGRRALVGDVRLAVELLGGPAAAREKLAGWGIVADLGAECAARFDRAAAQLAAEGFRVTRAPVLPLDGAAAYAPCVTYTNALVETFPDGRSRVYLPVYGIEALDRAASATWRQLGFEVRTVNVAPVWKYGGTLDCLVGVLRRD